MLWLHYVMIRLMTENFLLFCSFIYVQICHNITNCIIKIILFY